MFWRLTWNTRSLLICGALLCTPALLLAERIEEKYDNGKTKVRYAVNEEKKKDGRFQSFYESGKPKIKAVYKEGLLNGTYFEYDEQGKPKIKASYKEGELHGPFTKYDGRKIIKQAVYIDGQIAFPKSQKQIVSMFAEIDRMKITINRPDDAKGDTSLEERKKAVRF